ncbi:MAG: hypothetical protein EKK54_00885 [Neisseriaceae bacterium]|nr:MAG: hypothetical protein EKK54_00885 [Neisseriaceae bacterium]
MKFLNLHNYRDRNYRYVIASCVLSFVLIGDILNPLLNFIAINLPAKSNNFYDYATLATIIPSLPFLFSFLISYLVNNYPYRKIIHFNYILLLGITMVLFVINVNNITLIAAFIALSGIIFRAIYFSLDKQLTTILAAKARDFMADITIFGALIGSINIKFAGYIYAHYQTRGILLIFAIGLILLWWCAAQIPAVQSLESKSALPSLHLRQLFLTIWKFPSFIRYLIVMASYLALSSPFYLLLTTKVHQEAIGIERYTSLMAAAMFCSIAGAMCCKLKFITQQPAHKIIGLSIFANSLCWISLSYTSTFMGFSLYYILSSTVSIITLVHMNTLILQHINSQPELVKISPLVSGAIASLFYLSNLIGPLLCNLLFKVHLNYLQIYIAGGIIQIAIAAIVFKLKNQPHKINP